MTRKHESRRVRMTKRLMKDALLELMEHHDLISISVTAICENADVHRTTFYNYYKDPAELLRDIEQDFLNRIPVPPDIPDQGNRKALLAAATDFFDYVKDNKKTIRVLFSKSYGNNFTTRMVEHLIDGYVPVYNDTEELPARFTQLYIANGAVGMMREWVNSDFPVSSEKIAEMMYSFSVRIARTLE